MNKFDIRCFMYNRMIILNFTYNLKIFFSYIISLKLKMAPVYQYLVVMYEYQFVCEWIKKWFKLLETNNKLIKTNETINVNKQNSFSTTFYLQTTFC